MGIAGWPLAMERGGVHGVSKLILVSVYRAMQNTDASKEASYGNVAMQGQEVFKFAVRSVPAVIDAALKKVLLQLCSSQFIKHPHAAWGLNVINCCTIFIKSSEA